MFNYVYIYIYSYYNADSNGVYNTNQNSHDNTNIYIYNANSKAYNTNQHSNKHHIITPINIIMPMKIRHRPLRHEVWRRSSPGGGLNMWRFRHGDPPLFNGRSPGS